MLHSDANKVHAPWLEMSIHDLPWGRNQSRRLPTTSCPVTRYTTQQIAAMPHNVGRTQGRDSSQ